jgi:hypothetical protein
VSTIRLPDGCTGLDFADGTKYDAPRQGGTVDLEPGHARNIGTSWYGQTGVMSSSQQFSFGTKDGRRCASCKRTWNNWSLVCPRCGRDTEPEAVATSG